MLDIRLIRENPEIVRQALRDRHARRYPWHGAGGLPPFPPLGSQRAPAEAGEPL